MESFHFGCIYHYISYLLLIFVKDASLLKGFQDQLLDNVVLRGVRGINKVTLRKVMDGIYEKDGSYQREESWVLDTVGTNLMGLLAIDYIDTNRTFTNDIQEVYRVLGIEAARRSQSTAHGPFVNMLPAGSL